MSFLEFRMELYDLNAFNASLAPKPYCTNDLSSGLRIRQKNQAVQYKYIQANDNYIKFLIVDCDHSNPYIWEQVGLPAPNLVVIDKNKRTSHLLWALSSPIYKDYVYKAKNIALFAKIQQVYTMLCNGDRAYIGLMTKNPNNNFWQTININYFYAYDLYELADYVKLPQKILKRDALGEGRNCWLFDTVRKFAYKEVLLYKENANFQTFFNVVLAKLEKLNVFENSIGLQHKELWHIAKSISKWTWKHFSASKFSEIQTVRSHKRKAYKQKEVNIEGLKNELS